MRSGFFSLALAAAVAADDSSTGSENNPQYKCEFPSTCWYQLDPIAPVPPPKGRSGGAQPSATTNINIPAGGIASGLFNIDQNDIYPNSVEEAEANDAAADPTKPKPRFGAKVPLQFVANYGCWCYAFSQWTTGEGRSAARDEHDDNCKAHSMGFKCISVDAKYEKKECQPYETDYDITVTRGDEYGQIYLECANSIEDDWCRRRTCMVELRLVARYWKLMDNGVWPAWHKWAHPNIGGGFDPMVECTPSPGKEPIELRCCGDYPYRSWYYSLVSDPDNGANQCCVYQDGKVNADYGFSINIGQVYNQHEQSCTKYGVV